MSLEIIENIDSAKGYNDFVEFVNNELANPSAGVHTDIITTLVSTVQSDNYFCFIGELYTDSSNYYGCIVVDPLHRILIIQNKEVIYLNMNSGQVTNLFTMSSSGLKTFYSGEIPLFTKSGAVALNKSFEINGALEFGDEIYYSYLVNDNTRTHTGRISGQEVENQKLGSYNLKIDKLSIDLITLVGQRDQLTRFQIRIAANVVQSFEYTYLGQVLYVQNTEDSRIDIRRLERDGVISSNL